MNAVTQFAHRIDMFDPVAVHDTQHDIFFKRQELFVHRFDFFFVTSIYFVHTEADHAFTVLALNFLFFDMFFLTHAKHREALADAFVINFVFMMADFQIGGNRITDNTFEHAFHHIMNIFMFQDIVALFIHDLTLFTENIIIFKQLFAGIEVISFHAFLCLCN